MCKERQITIVWKKGGGEGGIWPDNWMEEHLHSCTKNTTVRHTPHIHNQMHNRNKHGAVKNKMICTTLSRINIQKSEEN